MTRFSVFERGLSQSPLEHQFNSSSLFTERISDIAVAALRVLPSRTMNQPGIFRTFPSDPPELAAFLRLLFNDRTQTGLRYPLRFLIERFADLDTDEKITIIARLNILLSQWWGKKCRLEQRIGIEKPAALILHADSVQRRLRNIASVVPSEFIVKLTN